jgi:CHAD domain-containing protein
VQRAMEREAKFAIAPEAGTPELAPLPAGLRVVERDEVRLSARYFDTADLGLLRRGITLRHRHDLSGTGEELWTLKLPDAETRAARSASVLSRTEVSWPGAESGDVPEEARRLLTAILHDVELRAVAAFVTVRRRREVRDDTGRRLAEIDDDRVTVTAPTAKVFRQIEVELDAGDDDLIARLTELLRRGGASPSNNAEKLRLALADRIAEIDAAAPPPPAGPLTLGELFRQRTVASVDKLVGHDIGLRLEQRSEDVHQARVACRRLRSDIKTFAPILDPGWVAETTEELRWWGNVAGAGRDLDVLERRIAGHATGDDDPDAEGFAALGVRISAQRVEAWERLRAGLDSQRYVALLRRLDAAKVAPPLARSGPPTRIHPGDLAADSLGALVGRPWRRLRHTVRDLPSDPSDDQLHRVRIRAKQLRYSAESATSVVGAPAERLAGAAEALQTELGDFHDAVVAVESLRHLAQSVDREAAFVAGRCAAVEQEAARSQRSTWPAVWRGLDDKKLRWWLR